MDLTLFYKSLEIMAQGMTGILIFMSLFYGLIVGLQKLFPVKKEQ
jgi:hypothetical protein